MFCLKVYKWIKSKGHNEIAEGLLKEEVDGKAFLYILEEDIMFIEKMGPRKRFLDDFYTLIEKLQDEEQIKLSKQITGRYISFTCYDGAMVSLCCRGFLFFKN